MRTDLDRAERWLDEALCLSRETDDEHLASYTLWCLGHVAVLRKHHDQARHLLEESVALAREARSPQFLGWALLHLGYLVLMHGERSRAGPMLEEALALLRGEGHSLGVGQALLFLGYATLSDGRPDPGRALIAESLAWARRVGDWADEAWLELAAALEERFGSPERGIRLFAALEAERRRTRTEPRPVNPSDCDVVANARSVLGEEAFARAWAEGQAMTLEQAVECALREVE